MTEETTTTPGSAAATAAAAAVLLLAGGGNASDSTTATAATTTLSPEEGEYLRQLLQDCPKFDEEKMKMADLVSTEDLGKHKPASHAGGFVALKKPLLDLQFAGDGRSLLIFLHKKGDK